MEHYKILLMWPSRRTQWAVILERPGLTCLTNDRGYPLTLPPVLSIWRLAMTGVAGMMTPKLAGICSNIAKIVAQDVAIGHKLCCKHSR